MGLDEKGIGVCLDEGLQLHEMKGHLEQPLRLVFRLTLPVLPSNILHGSAVVGVGTLRTGGGQPTSEFRNAESNDKGPRPEGHTQDREILRRFVHVEIVNPLEKIEGIRRVEQILDPRPTGVVRGTTYRGIFTL